MPKVSVIIPNYNHARFLEQRIESVLHQTFQDFEIIFLDDASTDDSKEVFSKYINHPKISQAIFNEANSNSTFKQWNKGIDLAAGEYIWIAESDDYAALQFLEELVPILDQNQNVGLAYCQSCIVNEKDQLVSPDFCSCTDDLDLTRWSANYSNEGRNECINFLSAKNTIPNASAVLIRKAIYKSEVDRNNESFKVAGDWFTWSKILLNSDIYFIAESLNYFRIYQGSVSNNSVKLPIVIGESFLIFDQTSEKIEISHKAQKIFFDLVSSWWITYFVIGNIFSWDREFGSYQQLVRVSPNRISTLFLHWQLITVPWKRFKYSMKLRTRLNTYKEKLSVFRKVSNLHH